MKWINSYGFYFILLISALLILIFSIFDVIFNKNWIYITIGLYILIIFLTIFFFLTRKKSRKNVSTTIGEFEKSLKGGLYHFKCPSCYGIFAIKKSKSNNKNPLKMTCPDCGTIGFIPIIPKLIESEIPEKKSIKANFRCLHCGEGITVWAEGTNLFENVNIFCCPFCGEQKTMNRI